MDGDNTAWKVSKYEVFLGLYFPVFGLNTGKYGLGHSSSSGNDSIELHRAFLQVLQWVGPYVPALII